MVQHGHDVIFLTQDAKKAQGLVMGELSYALVKFTYGDQYVKVGECVAVFVEKQEDARLLLSPDVHKKAVITTDKFGQEKT